RHIVPQDRKSKPLPLRQREPVTREARVVGRQQATHDLPRLADGGDRIRLIQTEWLQPGPTREPEEGPPVRRRVEHGRLACDLHGMNRERVETRRPDSYARRRSGDLE